MNFGELLIEAYRLAEDEGQFAWDNPAVAKSCNYAVRTVLNRVGANDARQTLNFVTGTRTYVVPAGVRRIISVQILPEIPAGGTQAQAGPPLIEVDLENNPVVLIQNAEPTCYTLNLIAGANSNQFEITFNTAPDRTTNGAIILTYEPEYIFLSDDPATTPQKDVDVPFPDQYHDAIARFAAYKMLSERSDEAEIARSAHLKSTASDDLEEQISIHSTQYPTPVRDFP